MQVVDAGSMSGASRALGLTLPTVSRDIAHLEEELGVILLQRTTRRLSVTDEGRAFYVRARRVLDELAAAEDEVGPAGAVRGTVRLVLPTITVPFGFASAVRTLMHTHPQLRLQISLDDQPVDLVGAGWDIAVSFGAPADATHILRKLASVEAMMAAAPSYAEQFGLPAHPSELVDHACLRAIGVLPQASWLLRGPDGQTGAWPVAGRLEIDSSVGLDQAMYAGLGIGLASRGGLAVAERSGALVRVLPRWTWAAVPVYALLPAGRNRIPRVRIVLEWLSSWLGSAFD